MLCCTAFRLLLLTILSLPDRQLQHAQLEYTGLEVASRPKNERQITETTPDAAPPRPQKVNDYRKDGLMEIGSLRLRDFLGSDESEDRQSIRSGAPIRRTSRLEILLHVRCQRILHFPAQGGPGREVRAPDRSSDSGRYRNPQTGFRCPLRRTPSCNGQD